MNNLEDAILREIEGGKYYREQAEENKDNTLNMVFLSLAKDEDKHAEILQKKAKKLSYEFKKSEILSNLKVDFNNFKENKIESPIVIKQLEAYKIAIQNERQSIQLYENFLSEANNDRDRKLFEYLIIQEKEHFSILEELIHLISRTDEWVESAEFGIREEY